VLAGAAKLALGRSWPEQARGFGAPAWAAVAVPWVELAIGAASIAQLAKPFAAFAAIGILLLFTALIVSHLLAGRAPECACFGAWSAKPIGPGHLVRNTILLTLAVLALWS
jgi:Methylamine utilisation protein MauE